MFYKIKPLLIVLYDRRSHFFYPQSSVYDRRHIATEFYLDEPCLDVLIVQKLRKNEEFLAQKLVSEVDSGVHDPRAVCSDGVGDVTDVDGVQMFVV